jgi:hypothetical protein
MVQRKTVMVWWIAREVCQIVQSKINKMQRYILGEQQNKVVVRFKQ